MKLLLTLVLIIWTSKAVCQSYLCEVNSVLYSVCYQLKPNGEFTYDYSHCTGSVLGKGTFEMSEKSVSFVFDTITSPKIISSTSHLSKGQVKISYFHLSNGYPFENAPIYYNQIKFQTDTLGVLTLDYSGGPIKIYQIHFGKDSILIHPDKDGKNNYEIFWHTTGDIFMPKGRKIEMVKRGKKFKSREKVLGYNAEKDKYFRKWRTKFYVEPKE